MKLGRVKQIHFVGIGGSGMSGIAGILLDLGYDVSGSDVRRSAVIARLEAQGARINIGHEAAAVEGAEVVVRSTAVEQDNCEIVAAHNARIPVIHRAEMLAELMRLKQGIAVAGAHGKTTTTSLIAHILEECGLDPTVVIGGKIKTLDANGKLGQGDLLVAEADESDGSFLRLRPVIAVINNLDEEHLEYWGSYAALKQATLDFANAVPFYGTVLIGQDDPELAAMRSDIRRPVRTYGVDAAADLQAFDLSPGPETVFSIRIDGQDMGRCTLPLSGKHNVQNALAAIGVAQEVGVPLADAIAALDSFPGIERRFEILREGRPIIVDDYGHHPAELNAVIAAARGRWQVPLMVVFQPHRYSRTQQLWDDFRSVLLKPDHVRITDVYPAGEAAREGIEASLLARAVHDSGHPDVRYVAFEHLIDELRAEPEKDCVMLFLGAGNITGKAHELASALA